MPQYKAEFVGRKLHAIGKVYPITIPVEADNPEAAELRLYDQFDHIQGLRLTVIVEGLPGEGWGQQLDEASKLPDEDLARHASVSRNNRHRCRSCFCCAARTVKETRAAMS